MCGREGTCERAFSYVWQAKGLRAHFLHVWQGKDLETSSTPRPGRGRQGNRERGVEKVQTPTPPGNADGYQNKGVAGKAIRKTMKTKGRQNRRVANTLWVVEGGRGETGTL